MLELKEKVANVISEVNGIVTHTLSQSLDDPGFLKRAMALVLFDDFCADCTTVRCVACRRCRLKPAMLTDTLFGRAHTGDLQNERRSCDGKTCR